MSTITKTSTYGVYDLIFDRTPKNGDKDYCCKLSTHEQIPKIIHSSEYYIEEGNNSSPPYITFFLYGDITPYNKYYQSSVIKFGMTHDCRHDKNGNVHSLYDYYQVGYKHRYR